MAKRLWKQVEEKVDKVAEAVALMERGEFEFKDGKQHWTNVNGKREPRVVKADAMEYAGYARDGKSCWTNIFTDDGQWHTYYRERLVWHRQRLSGGYKQALAELTDGGGALKELSKLAFEALCYKLKDPEKAAKEFPLKDLAKVYLESTKLEAQVSGEASTRREGTKELGPSVVTNLNLQLPESYMERMEKQQAELIEGELAE